MDGAHVLLDKVGPDGGAALLAGEAARENNDGSQEPGVSASSTEPQVNVAAASDTGESPAPGALHLTGLVSGSGAILELARKLLADAWVVERLEDVKPGFKGVACTRSGRVLFGTWGELRQVTAGGAERVLARRNERDRLIAESERVVAGEHVAREAVEQALEQLREADSARDHADAALRERERSPRRHWRASAKRIG